MKQIKAVVRPSKVDAVKNALVAIDVQGMTICEARGFGRQRGQVERYRGNEFRVDFIPKVRLELVVDEAVVDRVVEVIVKSAGTGKIGDGKVWITEVSRVVRIRTGEEDETAV